MQAGATVSLYTSRESYYASQPYQTTKAGANGQAVFNVAPGKYFITAEWQDVGKLASSMVPNELASTATLKKGYVPEGLFQSTEDVTKSPKQAYAKPGNFKWKDINSDGNINANDLVELPSANTEISGSNVSVELLIGSIENSLMSLPVTKEIIYGLLTNCAAKLYDANNKMSTIDALLSDDADCASFNFQSCDLDNFAFNSLNGRFFDAWAAFYAAVRNANLVIDYASYIELSDEEKVFIQAEAKAYRGYAYLMLTTYYGQAAIMTKPLGLTDEPPLLSPRPEALQQAAKDLKEAGNELQFPSGYYKPGNITKYGAIALSARVALLAKNYTDAKSYSEAVIKGPFNFSANVTDVFNKLNDQELIWSYPLDTEGPPVNNVISGQGKYRPFVRLAEVYLNKAEALIYNGQYQDAREPLSTIALRRGITLDEFTTKEKALEALYEISRVETYREGRRYANLVRWGIAGKVLRGYQDRNNILPIPYQDLVKIPNAKQNPGYPN
ncbi:MAG: RagB/SusD family nutrient uptake outer membrane protein [Sphingobacteriaceae bacterium]|nr:MAG: RagB/SusD family nutrient uptake outer membrane protein [Sphingobacteriaceae bacterium]